MKKRKNKLEYKQETEYITLALRDTVVVDLRAVGELYSEKRQAPVSNYHIHRYCHPRYVKRRKLSLFSDARASFYP